MNTIHLSIQRDPAHQWRSWVGALSRAGFKVELIKADDFCKQVGRARAGDVILLDGMLVDLSSRIYCACAQAPEANVVVLTEIDSFTIKYEVLSVGGAIYISGPMASGEFVESITRVAGNQAVGLNAADAAVYA